MNSVLCEMCRAIGKETKAMVGSVFCQNCYDTAIIKYNNYDRHLNEFTDEKGRVHKHLVNRQFTKVLTPDQMAEMVRPECDECAEAMGFDSN